MKVVREFVVEHRRWWTLHRRAGLSGGVAAAQGHEVGHGAGAAVCGAAPRLDPR